MKKFSSSQHPLNNSFHQHPKPQIKKKPKKRISHVKAEFIDLVQSQGRQKPESDLHSFRHRR